MWLKWKEEKVKCSCYFDRKCQWWIQDCPYAGVPSFSCSTHSGCGHVLKNLYTCQNERIGCLGGMSRRRPLDPPMNRVSAPYLCEWNARHPAVMRCNNEPKLLPLHHSHQTVPVHVNLCL